MDLLALHNSPRAIAEKTSAIRDELLRTSRHLKTPNFTTIATDDLASLFKLYDRSFFDGWLWRTVIERTGRPLSFRLSSTMTRAGGKTIFRGARRNTARGTHVEIAVASRMLFLTFHDASRPVTVCGLACPDRLWALQHIMEHEILHLAEFLTWGTSSCSQERFQTLASRIFGHTLSTHDLVTPGEHAAAVHGLRIGQTVAFEYEGASLVGRLNRIHRRATVLVPNEKGMPYDDGRRYMKYYVPLPMLRVVQ